MEFIISLAISGDWEFDFVCMELDHRTGIHIMHGFVFLVARERLIHYVFIREITDNVCPFCTIQGSNYTVG